MKKINYTKLRKRILSTLNEYVNLDIDTLNELGIVLEAEVLKWIEEEDFQ